MFGTWSRDQNRPLRRLWDATTSAVIAEQNVLKKLEQDDETAAPKEHFRHRYRFHLFVRQRHESTRPNQEDTNEDPCVYVDERPKSGLLGLWNASTDDTGPKFFNLFPLRQLFIPRLPYPLWDINWDTCERKRSHPQVNIEFSHHNTPGGSSQRLVTRHIFLVKNGQYHGGPQDKDQVLTDLGRTQARLTGQRLANFIAQNDAKHGPCKVKLLCTSELTRAIQMADIIERELKAMHLKSETDDYVVDRCPPDPLLNEGVPAHHIPAENAEANHLDKLVEAIDVDHPRIEAAFQKYIARSQWLEDQEQLAISGERRGQNRRTLKRRNSDGGSVLLTPKVASHVNTDACSKSSLSRCISELDWKAASNKEEHGESLKKLMDEKSNKNEIEQKQIEKKEEPLKERPGLDSHRSSHHLYNKIGVNIGKWGQALASSAGADVTNPDGRHHEYEILVTHANVIRYFLCRVLQIPPEAWLRFEILNASVTYIIIKGHGSAMCQMVGDTGHLPYDKVSGGANDGFSWEDRPVINRTTPELTDSKTRYSSK